MSELLLPPPGAPPGPPLPPGEPSGGSPGGFPGRPSSFVSEVSPVLVPVTVCSVELVESVDLFSALFPQAQSPSAIIKAIDIANLLFTRVIKTPPFLFKYIQNNMHCLNESENSKTVVLE